MLKELKKEVFEANLELVKKGMVIYTWGNVSGIDRDANVVIIKPSGVDYDNMHPDDMVAVDLETGKIIEGNFKPSSDTPTHLELYKAFPEIKGITHTHSTNAVAFSQAGLSIRAMGTTHADYFYGDIPCTRKLSIEEVENQYEYNTGKVIVETIRDSNQSPMSIPGILVKNHGPFTWGTSPSNSVYNAVVLEKIAEINLKTLILNPKSNVSQYLLDKHYYRKHGEKAYYGQN